jgi:hypothetical protein
VLSAINEAGSTRVEIKVTVKANFAPNLFGQHVIVKIPTPKNTATCRLRVTAGKAFYKPELEAVIWKIKRFPGGAEFGLSGEMKLAQSVSLEVRPLARTHHRIHTLTLTLTHTSLTHTSLTHTSLTHTHHRTHMHDENANALVRACGVLEQKKGWTNRPPIAMQFQVPMFTSSGFDVRFLKVTVSSFLPPSIPLPSHSLLSPITRH